MKNLQQIISSPTYIGGWLVALHNYNEVEIESINHSVSIINENQLINSREANKNHFTTRLGDKPLL